jgi:hypothetical protein
MSFVPVQIETIDANGTQWSIPMEEVSGLSWSSHYGEGGSGFGYLKFTLSRQVGFDYRDIGFGYDIIVRKYLKTILFDGQIRTIEEKSGPDGDSIVITGLGPVVAAGDDEILRHFCDTRISEWHVDPETPRGSYRPDLYTTGRNALGLFIHTSNDKTLASGDYTEMGYEFPSDESAERFKCNLSMVLGSGTAFDGQVDSIDAVSGYIDYKNDSGEGQVVAGMVVYNSTQALTATVQSINTTTNRITVTAPSEISGWASDDELAIYGPLFEAQISNIAAAVITYTSDQGEGNIAANQALANMSKKAIATVQSNNTGSDTITVTDENHLSGWEVDDVIAVCAPYFSATYTSKSGTTVTYSGPIGERVASSATGWVVHNVDEDEYATVASWTIGSNQFDVTDAGDLTANWTNGDELKIYTPFKFEVLDSGGTTRWPASDWRQGAVAQDRTAINVTTAGNPSGFELRMESYIAGTADETSFVQLDTIRAYSTTSDSNVTTLAKAMVTLLSAAGHGLSSSEDEIETISNTLEPMVFEFSTPADALTWACRFGDGSSGLVAWGVRLDDTKKLFVETQDLSTIDYVARRTGPIEMSASGDIQDSFQQVRGVYNDKLGKQQITAWQSDSDHYFNSKYRRKSVKLDSVDTDAEAIAAVTLFLTENKEPKRTTSYAVGEGSVFSMEGLSISVDELKATGRLAMVEDWRAIESGLSGTDLRDYWTKEQIVAVEVNYDEGTATLTPAGARKEFERYMADLAQITQI